MTMKKAFSFQPQLLLAALCLGALCLAACKKSAVEGSTEVQEAPAVSVQTEAATAIEVPRMLRLTGSLRGNREADLAANASGRVLAVSFERGDEVKAGQLLATLDVRAATLTAAEARAQASSVRAQEEPAKDECARYEQLKQKGAISDLEYQQRVTQCRTLPLSAEAASARAALAAQNVGDGKIRAPFSGIIAERFVEVGQYVRHDSKVASIVSVDPVRLELAVPEAEVAKVSEGAEVRFVVAAYPDRAFTGSVKFVSGVVRRNTRDLVVEALVDNPERRLLPGMFADAQLRVGSDRLPSVPRSALVQRAGQSHVFVVADGRLEERVVALGPALGERVSIQRGVKAGERVVVSDPNALGNGQKVALGELAGE
jgi:RND family efflux transporter MFP subunit